MAAVRETNVRSHQTKLKQVLLQVTLQSVLLSCYECFTLIKTDAGSVPADCLKFPFSYYYTPNQTKAGSALMVYCEKLITKTLLLKISAAFI
jgi:hypothetical protein